MINIVILWVFFFWQLEILSYKKKWYKTCQDTTVNADIKIGSRVWEKEQCKFNRQNYFTILDCELEIVLRRITLLSHIEINSFKEIIKCTLL